MQHLAWWQQKWFFDVLFSDSKQWKGGWTFLTDRIKEGQEATGCCIFCLDAVLQYIANLETWYAPRPKMFTWTCNIQFGQQLRKALQQWLGQGNLLQEANVWTPLWCNATMEGGTQI
jgi:hypothetical protein